MNGPPFPSLVLHHFPGACSRVSLFALEQAGLPYDLRLVDLAADEQSRPDYRAVSPLGKAPALLVDGESLTENAAILTYIAALRPKAGLFPPAETPLALARRQQGLSFCGATLHPIVRGVAMPSRLTDGDEAPVRDRSIHLATEAFKYAERRLAETGWWLGEISVVDVYLDWAVSTARRGGFALVALPRLAALQGRLLERPAFARMMEIEGESTRLLDARRAPAALAQSIA